MAVLHQLNCAANYKNTGYGGCPVDFKLINGAIIFHYPISFEAAQLSALSTYLQSLAWNNSASLRCYPIANFVNPTDATEEPVIQTFADGSKAVVRDGVFDWKFQFTAGGFCLAQALRTHNSNTGVYAIFYDKNNTVIGYNNNGKLSAIPLQIFYADPWKMNTGQVTAAYMAHFVFATSYGMDNIEYTSAGFDMTTIVGLQDIKIIVNGFNAATGLANITLLTQCGGSNMYTNYSSDITASLFNATNEDTGQPITVTSVTGVASNSSFNVQLNTGSNYTTDGNIQLGMALPSVLSAAGLVGFVGETVILSVTSS
jgi:hypothetical protein